MALDFMAIVTTGTYPTPTPTDAERAISAVSYGLLGTAASEAEAEIDRSLLGLGLCVTTK